MSGNQRGIRLFGHDIDIDAASTPASTSSHGHDESLLLNTPLSIRPEQDLPPIYLQPSENSNERQTLHGLMQRLYSRPNLTLLERQAIIGNYLCHYRFPMIRPCWQDIQSLMDGTSVRGADITGHPNNDLILRQYFDHIYPLNAGYENQRRNQLAKLELQAFQAAMRYLNSHPTAGVMDERSGKILMSPNWRRKRFKLLLHDLFAKYECGMLPKLRQKADRIHFKTSDDKKGSHRRPGGRSQGRPMEEETSSEDEY